MQTRMEVVRPLGPFERSHNIVRRLQRFTRSIFSGKFVRNHLGVRFAGQRQSRMAAPTHGQAHPPPYVTFGRHIDGHEPLALIPCVPAMHAVHDVRAVQDKYIDTLCQVMLGASADCSPASQQAVRDLRDALLAFQSARANPPAAASDR